MEKLMKYLSGSIFDVNAEAICVMTNGKVVNGELTMDSGLAKEFANRWPQLPKIFGSIVSKYGNCVVTTLPRDLDLEGFVLFIPDTTDLDVWKASIQTLVIWANEFEEQEGFNPKIILPRPTSLPWSKLQAIFEDGLDGRFSIIQEEDFDSL